MLAAPRDRLGSRGVSVLGILTRDEAAQGRALLSEVGAGQLTSVQDPDGGLAVSWGATGVPETFLVDRTGTIRARRLGPVTDDWACGVPGRLRRRRSTSAPARWPPACAARRARASRSPRPRATWPGRCGG